MTSLADCYHNGWGRHNCDHNEDVSIKCAVPTTTEIGRCTCTSFASGLYTSGGERAGSGGQRIS